MPDFEVIQGGGKGPPDRRAGEARYHLAQAIVEILRSLARGYVADARISHHLVEFMRVASFTDVPLEVVIEDTIVELNKELDHRGEQSPILEEHEEIVLRALQVAAEALAIDPAAKGRLSNRQGGLLAAIANWQRGREERRRERLRSAPKSPEKAAAEAKRVADRLKNLGRKTVKRSKNDRPPSRQPDDQNK